MSTLEAKVPDLLLQQVHELAKKELVPVDQIVAIALAAQVSAWSARERIGLRASRVDWQQVDEVLSRVPDVPPVPGDELKSETHG
ncbi:MAG: hypothetical protein HS122_00785 [Opitutaceae bacterium]|nr:hypothetical protein [Opitutaceae bacterium]